MTDIVLLTEDRFIAPVQHSDYINNILKEDAILTAALEKHGLRIKRKSWSDPDYNWEHTKYAMFRTTWDYFDRFTEFKTWLDVTSQKTLFINPIETIRWNLDKH